VAPGVLAMLPVAVLGQVAGATPKAALGATGTPARLGAVVAAPRSVTRRRARPWR
jgi:hypothetical protein